MRLLANDLTNQMYENAKNEIQKVREIEESYLCLQRFDNIWTWSAGNRKRKLCKFAKSSIVKRNF